MKDLNKIREKYENEIKLAKISNSFEAIYKIEPRVIESNGQIILVADVENESAKRILNGLQATKKFVVNDTATGCKNPVEAFYKLQSFRGFSDRHSTLKIVFYNNNIKIWLNLQIDGNSVLQPFFYDGMRKISDSERSTYKPTRGNQLIYDYDISCKRFKGEQITYYGGYFVSTDCTIINDIIEAIKNS